MVNEFLSSTCNHRTDEYGGSFENRIRLLLEIVKEMRSIIKKGLPLFVRISATEWVNNGWNENDSVALGKDFKRTWDRCDLIVLPEEIPQQKIPVAPLYQVPFSEKIKKNLGY